MTTPEKPTPPEDEKKNEGGFQEKITDKMEDLKKNKQVEQMYEFARSNTKDAIAYIVLFVGFILLLFDSYWGPLLIGLVVGLYFGDDIIHWLINFRSYVEAEGYVRSIILGALALALLWYAPWIFLGAAVVVVLKYLLAGVSK